MPTKKQLLAQLQGDWTAGEIRVTYKQGIKPYHPIGDVKGAYRLIYSLWDKQLITLQEQYMAVFMNRRGQVIGYRLLNTGTMVSCEVDVRLLVSLALHCMASGVVIAHNHPSGILTASEADIKLTSKIKAALLLINVMLLDNIIITADSYLSFLNEEML